MDNLTETREVKVLVANRFPPGDRWKPTDNSSIVLESLTEVLQYVYEKNGNTQFFLDAKQGTVSLIATEVIKIEVEPEKQWSLYGE